MKTTIQEHLKANIKIGSKNVILVIMLLFIAFSTQAQEVKNKNAKRTIVVNGNCEQCQRRIQKAAFSVNGVKTASWNMETHQLLLTINEEKTTLLEIKKAIAKAGHDAEEVKASDTVYSKLPDCCQYERD